MGGGTGKVLWLCIMHVYINKHAYMYMCMSIVQKYSGGAFRARPPFFKMMVHLDSWWDEALDSHLVSTGRVICLLSWPSCHVLASSCKTYSPLCDREA